MVIIIIFGCLINSHYKTFFLKVYIHSLSEKYGNETGDSSSIRQINEIADFLLDNMKSHYGITESDYLFLLKYYSAWTSSTKNVIELMDSIESQDGCRPKQSGGIIEDKNIIDYDSLWHYALDLYKLHNSSPLCNMIDNDYFLEFVVPYRVDIEPLNLNWRDDENGFLEKFKKSLIIYPTDRILDIANMAMNKWNETPFKWTDGLPHWGCIGEKHLTIKGGNCKDFGIGASYLMRYIGIPSGMDMLFAREGEDSAHYWPFIIDEHGDTYFATQDTPYWSASIKMDLPATKIYRHTFSEHHLFNVNEIGTHEIHPRFRSNHLKDVTEEYRDVYDISVTLTSKCPLKTKTVYLCNATRDKWMPVDIGSTENGLANFQNIASSEIACVVAYWDGKNMIPLSLPFTIDSGGKISYFRYSDNYIISHIYCKYPLNAQNGDVVDRVIGGRIEGANSKDFSDAELIYEIMDSPKRKITKVEVSPKRAFRYIKYVGADGTHCNIAELEIFENELDVNIAIGCPTFGTTGDNSGKGTHEYMNVFDGDLYTSFDYKFPSGGWSAVDLLYPRKLTAVSYSPRNRDNYIRKDDLYELFYWNDKDNNWLSLGKQKAVNDELLYEIPNGCLLFLKNHTRGVNERVFEYDNKEGVQIFH